MQSQMKTLPEKMAIRCLSCGDKFDIVRNLKIGNLITCKSCASQFEAVKVQPTLISQPGFDDDFVDMYGYYGDESFYDDIDDSDEIDDLLS